MNANLFAALRAASPQTTSMPRSADRDRDATAMSTPGATWTVPAPMIANLLESLELPPARASPCTSTSRSRR
jgi:hypothetical protein